LDFAYNATRLGGAVVLYAKGIYADVGCNAVLSARDRYLFYARNFKSQHAIFMLWRKGIFNFAEWRAFLSSRKVTMRKNHLFAMPRPLLPMEGSPTVSYIIPTMSRQDYTLALLADLSAQTHLPLQVVVVDATPEAERDQNVYDASAYPFVLDIIWQKSKGSCRARNEAIAICRGDYIVFGDDDIRIPSNFIENH